jgi:hypothetical protein
MLVETDKEEISGLSQKIYNLYSSGIDNFDIEISDILELSKDDFAVYEEELYRIANLIMDAYLQKNINICVNVLTDIFVKQKHSEDLKFFIFCKHCPCFQCEPNKEVFKRGTNDEYIPPWQYCEKAFIELKVSRYIAYNLGFPCDIAELDRQSLENYVMGFFGTKIYGGNFRDAI